MDRYNDGYWPPYVPVAERRRRATRKVAKLKKAGRKVSPVEVEGRKITTTFWGDAWCKNLEAYSDYSNRLPRGRTYVRNGSVIDLQIEAGRVRALVSGTSLYSVNIKIKPLPKQKWSKVKGKCAGRIGSLVELLQGSLSKSVMEIVTRKGEGLFPAPREITLSCSCPDWASMCKHVAAALYGVGARLDHKPELLFILRGVDPAEMVEAAIDQPTGSSKARKGRVLAADDLSTVFGVDIEMDMEGVSLDETLADAAPTKKRRRATKARKASASRSKKSTTKKATPKRAAANKAGTKQSALKKATAKKTVRKKTSPKKAASKTTTKKPARKKTAVKNTTAKNRTAKKKGAADRQASTMKTTGKAKKNTAKKQAASSRKGSTKKAGKKAKGCSSARD